MKVLNKKLKTMPEQAKDFQNPGYYFWKGYFKDLQNEYSQRNENLCSYSLTEIPQNLEIPNALNCFCLETQYPGLVTGVGMPHELPDTKGSCILGFYFDYTTGLPILPGSTIKGVLRNAFPQWKKHSKFEPETKKEAKSEYIFSLLKEILKVDGEFSEEEKKKWVNDVEEEIFAGIIGQENMSVYKRDLFFDAYIIRGTIKSPAKDRIFGIDNITPHIKENMSYEESLLKEPIPLTFLKVLPGVIFKFQFSLYDHSEEYPERDLLNKEQKLELFKRILTDFGVGAKTNVGYGQFEVFCKVCINT